MKCLVYLVVILSAQAHVLQPLPEKPGANCNAFQIWHQLRNLHSAMETWFDPTNAEQYTYAMLGARAPDTTELQSAMARAYEGLREAYLDLQRSPRFVELKTNEFPSSTLARLSTAASLYSHALHVHTTYAKFQTLLHRRMWDHRYIHSFFFTEVVDRKHRPLESFERLTTSSVRARIAVERLESILAGRLASVDRLAVAMIDSFGDLENENGPVATRKLEWRLDSEAELLKHQLRILNDRLLEGAQHANDIVLGRIPGENFEALKHQMMMLGTGLRESLDMVSLHSEIRRAGVPRRVYVDVKGTWLSNVNERLNEMFNSKGYYHSPDEIPKHLRGEEDENVYRLYAEGLLIQYVVTAGASMARLRDTPEVRGHLGNRLIQEARYRLNRLGTKAPSGGSTLAIATIGQPMEDVTHPPRSAFLTDKRQADASALEDELWKAFFDHAKWDESPWTKQGCGPALIATS